MKKSKKAAPKPINKIFLQMQALHTKRPANAELDMANVLADDAALQGIQLLVDREYSMRVVNEVMRWMKMDMNQIRRK